IEDDDRRRAMEMLDREGEELIDREEKQKAESRKQKEAAECCFPAFVRDFHLSAFCFLLSAFISASPPSRRAHSPRDSRASTLPRRTSAAARKRPALRRAA